MTGRRIIIGTAGHIDHGKSTLVRALTGIDPDRLPEEQERGMTIDLGFAFWKYGIAFIDVPGHERFIKNMVAGATGIDAALLVVAADDGIMPQTIEHHTILNLLGITRGIVAVTKIDGKDPDWVALVVEDVKKMLAGGSLAGSPVLAVDSVSGKGVPEFAEALGQLAQDIPERVIESPALLSIDRVFVKTGFGVVVTGTVVSGKISIGDELQLLPQKSTVRIRGIQSQNTTRDSVGAGERAALNLAGVDRETVVRGNRLCHPGVFVPTNAFDVLLTVCSEQPIKHRSRVRMHIGTAEVIGRLDLLDTTVFSKSDKAGYARFQSEEAVVAGFNERFVVRRYSPAETIGGGIVLNPMPLNRLRQEGNRERLECLRQSNDELQVIAAIRECEPKSVSTTRIAVALSMLPVRVMELCNALQKMNLIFFNNGSAVTAEFLSHEIDSLRKQLQVFHKANPERVGIPAMTLLESLQTRLGNSLSDLLIAKLQNESIIVVEKGIIRLTSHVPKVTEKESINLTRFAELLRGYALTPPLPSVIAEELNITEKEVYRFADLMRERGEVVVLESRFWILTEIFEAAKTKLVDKLQSQGSIALSEIAIELGVSRRYAVAIIEELDKRDITERVGDTRQLKKP